MILDKSLSLCDAKALDLTGGATNTMSTVLDLTKAGDAHHELFLDITFTTAPVGSGTIDIQLRTHTATITAGLGTILWSTGATAHTVNVKGKTYRLRLPRGVLRYLALQFTSTATLTAGMVDANLVETPDTNDE